MISKALAKARADYQAAGEKLVKETARAFPLGARIAVTLGRGEIIGEVLHAGGDWYYHPDNVTIRNIATGKTRDFRASGITGNSIRILSPERSAP